VLACGGAYIHTRMRYVQLAIARSYGSRRGYMYVTCASARSIQPPTYLSSHSLYLLWPVSRNAFWGRPRAAKSSVTHCDTVSRSVMATMGYTHALGLAMRAPQVGNSTTVVRT
jgi:hypothetical protein